MKRPLLIIAGFVLVVATAMALRIHRKNADVVTLNGGSLEDSKIQITDSSVSLEEVKENPKEISVPVDRASERVTKKPFGIYIDPKASPVTPERFRGYHTGTDFETFPEEDTLDVMVRALCAGSLIVKRRASGYGGVVVERCTLNGERVTVVYGHLALTSVSIGVGDTLERGDVIGILGAQYSADTDGERKHLHVSIHKGEAIDIRGYVESKQALDEWMDPCDFVCSE